MESLSRLVRVTLADYFKDLPIPETLGGWFSLSLSDWMRLVPFGAAVGGLSYLSVKGLTQTPGVGPFLQDRLSKLPGFAPTRVNKKVKIDCSKVVDTIDMEDIGDKAVFCRCWKSNKFPYCDGSHNKHNDETGDNVGPLIVKKSS